MKKISIVFLMASLLLLTSLIDSHNLRNAEAAGDPLYNSIVTGITNVQTTISLGKSGTDFNRVKKTYEQVINERPELFYAPNSYRVSSNGSTAQLLLSYKYSKAQITTMKTTLNAKVNSIVAAAKTKKTEQQKVLYIHNYLVNSAQYDYDNYLKGTIPDSSYSVYGVLINKKAVCDGYAKAMKLLLNKSGLWAIKVNGYANGGPHAWNLVKVSGKYYHVDATFDDPIASNRKPMLSYKYFLIPDSTVDNDHSWTRTGLPKAVSVKPKI
ncbi:transglutaminase/protease-like cytokinesis protein 3 [Peribacillus deserti]|uniref:Transglutaminase/protease-like cytokinesis protein 3 n=1 Tax=Peribacillus deserti TaxID=673318 RepID=A0ABS2QEW5_9BACI|nr:transglutaminase domain-containing protein [Peribacillus deserti]MBM7690851.1 transglutaminase/protease-like cytokinesis protein 3 [Peribacillus deserti]